MTSSGFYNAIPSETLEYAGIELPVEPITWAIRKPVIVYARLVRIFARIHDGIWVISA